MAIYNIIERQIEKSRSACNGLLSWVPKITNFTALYRLYESDKRE